MMNNINKKNTIAATLLASVVFSGCQTSLNIPTEELIADYIIVANGNGDTSVNASFETTTLFDFVTLDDAESISAEVNNEVKRMEKMDSKEFPFPLNMLVKMLDEAMAYSTTFSEESSGAEFTLSLKRHDGSIFISTAVLPDAPTLFSPMENHVFERDEEIIFNWQTVDSDVISMSYTSFCYDVDSAGDDIIKLYNLSEKNPDGASGDSDIIADTGSYQMSGNKLIGDAIPAAGVDRCKVLFRLTNSQDGVSDPNLHGNSSIEARQEREVMFYVKL